MRSWGKDALSRGVYLPRATDCRTVDKLLRPDRIADSRELLDRKFRNLLRLGDIQKAVGDCEDAERSYTAALNLSDIPFWREYAASRGRELLGVTHELLDWLAPRHALATYGRGLARVVCENREEGCSDLKNACTSSVLAACAAHEESCFRLYGAGPYDGLFPEPQPGWWTGPVQVQQLEGIATEIESFFAMLTGREATEPRVELEVSRTYSHSLSGSIRIKLSTEDLEAASLIRLLYEDDTAAKKLGDLGINPLHVEIPSRRVRPAGQGSGHRRSDRAFGSRIARMRQWGLSRTVHLMVPRGDGPGEGQAIPGHGSSEVRHRLC